MKRRDYREGGMTETAVIGTFLKNRFLSLPLRPARRLGHPAVQV